MEIGVAMFPTDYAMRPDDLARACEERGLESLCLSEHTHDPFVALAAAAAVTERLKLATGICLIVERDPIVRAKEVASLDLLSGGRFLFGIGGGWNAEEMEHHGVPFEKRWTAVREKIEG